MLKFDSWGPAFRNNEIVRRPLLHAPTAPIDAWTAALGQPAYITTTVADLLNRPPLTFRAWAHHNAAAFT
jgi:hypothetical protein